MTSRNLPFIPFPPFLEDSHSQGRHSSQVVKDPGRERGEGVGAKVPIHPTQQRTQPHDTQQKEGGGNEKECRAHTQPALTHNIVLPSGNTIGVLDRDLMPLLPQNTLP